MSDPVERVLAAERQAVADGAERASLRWRRRACADPCPPWLRALWAVRELVEEGPGRPDPFAGRPELADGEAEGSWSEAYRHGGRVDGTADAVTLSWPVAAGLHLACKACDGYGWLPLPPDAPESLERCAIGEGARVPCADCAAGLAPGGAA